VQPAKAFFATPPNRTQIPRLLAVLKRRSALDQGKMGFEDAIADAGAGRLALFRDDLSARDIQTLRKREGISRAVLARCLNLTSGQVSQLECGAKHARGATLKLLCLIEKKGLEVVL
jgi:DNA-binding transcriptional regulator YiaG